MKKLILLAALGAWLLTACAPLAPGAKGDGEAATPAPTSVAASTVAGAPTSSTVESAALAPATRPPLREEFVATDPATVNLALGQPQFVEFFAFY
jgi:hypothetical protein